MAKDRVIEVIGGIGQYGCSIDYMKYMMDQLGAGPITVKSTSMGGDVNHALKMKEMFQTHGDVTLEYIGFNASAATLLGHGAVKTVIHEDSFYLIHKPSILVEAWGMMNSDQMDVAIADLIANKKNAETVTLVIAQDYVNSRGMEMKSVMDLMKEARWLTAKEAVTFGLVDELIPSKGKKAPITNEALAMMTANGYPVPVLEWEDNDETEVSLFDKLKNLISPQNKITITMNKELLFINSALGVEGVEVKDNLITVTVEQMLALNAKFQDNATAVTNLTTEKQTAVDGQATAENSLKVFTDAVDALDVTVKAGADVTAKVAAITAKLAARPGAKAEKPQGPSGDSNVVTDETDWATINAMPHNQEADKEIY